MKLKIASNFLIFFFLIGWIIPVAYYGFTNSTPFWLPGPLVEKTNVSRLFFKEYGAWLVYEIQIRQADSTKFETVNENEFFHWRPFGFRTRFQRIVEFTGESRRKSLAFWLRDQLVARQHRVAAIRFISFPATTPSSGRAFGHYKQPGSQSVPPDKIVVLSEYEFKP